MPRVTVLDMQPIDPPVGGGRIRLLGLYHGLGENFTTTYIGSFDWRGPKRRQLQLTPTLTEIDVPLTEAHFSRVEEIKRKIPGKTIIDVTFPLFAYLSPDLIEEAKRYASLADIVVFSHPWLYPSVKNVLKSDAQLIVYDAHNCEGLLRTMLLDDGNYGTELARNVVLNEYILCHEADLILACSEEDKELFVKFYEINSKKIKVIPNGVFTKKIIPADDFAKKTEKARLKLEGFVSIFIGSNYPPNIEAVKVITDILAVQLPEMNFVIIGGAGDGLSTGFLEERGLKNIRVTGPVDEQTKLSYLKAADIAINPMLSGSGTNIKMFDFMAAGLPVVSTPIGARGIKDTIGHSIIVCEVDQFSERLKDLMRNRKLYHTMSKCARKLVEESYSWENISLELGNILISNLKYKNRGNKPFFSVIVPTYERHHLLSVLVELLSKQSDQDFEIIIVDQSMKKWEIPSHLTHLDILYFHTTIKGAVKARNTGIRLACGEVVAFIDDDCQPDADWLKNARFYFNDKNIIGVEGRIVSSNLGNPGYRTVTNEGFEGIGFMTANLFIKRDILEQIGGFDQRFDNPHFREDTDLGWRALKYGQIPYASDVVVYHPPHKRDIYRESLSERAKFFVHDPLLFKKHPNKFIDLFILEGHYKKTDGYWHYFLEGINKHGVPDMLYLITTDPRIDQDYVPNRIREIVNSKFTKNGSSLF